MTDLDTLVSNLKASDPLVRREAARALGEAGCIGSVPTRVVSALVEALGRSVPPELPESNPEHASRAAAAVALGRIGDPQATGALLDAMADPFNVGTAASTALGRLNPPPVRALVEATRDENPWKRARAVMALGEIGDRSAFDAMEALLWDSTDSVRRAAAAAFEKMRDPRAVAPLVDLLRDADASTFVRSYAAMALGALRDDRSVDPLLERLDDPDPLMRRAAARALARIGAVRAKPALERLAACDPDKTVRDVVARYLTPRKGQRPH